jgi:hypothetical protein
VCGGQLPVCECVSSIAHPCARRCVLCLALSMLGCAHMQLNPIDDLLSALCCLLLLSSPAHRKLLRVSCCPRAHLGPTQMHILAR